MSDQPDAADDPRTYEELLGDLEGLTERMATGGIGIEEATDLYEQAARLHALAAARLQSIEARVAALAAEPGENDGS